MIFSLHFQLKMDSSLLNFTATSATPGHSFIWEILLAWLHSLPLLSYL